MITIDRELRSQDGGPGDYIHVDVSDEFSNLAKSLVFALWLATFVAILISGIYQFRSGRSSEIGVSTVAMIGAVLMTALRSALEKTGEGPYFDMDHAVVRDLLVYLFSVSLLLASIDYCLGGHRYGLYGKIRSHLKSNCCAPTPSVASQCRNIFAISFVTSAVLSNLFPLLCMIDPVLSLAQDSGCDPRPYVLALLLGTSFGSTVTITGSLNGILIHALSYDEIGWIEYGLDMLLPVLLGTLICLVALHLMAAYFGSRRASSIFPEPAASTAAYTEVVTSAHTSDEERSGIELKTFADNDGDGKMPATQSAGQSCTAEAPPSLSAAPPTSSTTSEVTTEVEDEDHSWKSVTLLIILFLMILAWPLGLRPVAVSIAAASAALVVASIHCMSDDVATEVEVNSRSNQSSVESIILSKINYSSIILVTAQIVLAASLADTGLPQSALYNVLNWFSTSTSPDPEYTSYPLVLNGVLAMSSFLLGSPTTALFWADAAPYSTNYDWSQVAFVSSVVGTTWCILPTNTSLIWEVVRACHRQGISFGSWKDLVLLGALSMIVSIAVGTKALQLFHASNECSERLGECEF